jgi:adenosine deaminase
MAYSGLINSLSMRNFTPNNRLGNESGHDHFFNSFVKFGEASDDKGKILAEMMARANRQNILYLEIMTSPSMQQARDMMQGWQGDNKDFDSLYNHITKGKTLGKLVQQAKTIMDHAEQRAARLLNCSDGFDRCPVKVRYQAQVIRTFTIDKVFAQSVLAYELMQADKRFVGVNFVGPEDHPITLGDYSQQMQILNYLAQKYKAKYQDSVFNITLHAGELAKGLVPSKHLKFHVNEAIFIANSQRIGHGVDILHEDNLFQTLKTMSDRGIAVEINLTSNDLILGVKGKDQHPLPVYMQYKVPVLLSTDDEGVSRIDLTHEYTRAAKEYDLTYTQLKMLSRNSLEYAFLPGRSLWQSHWQGERAGTTPNSYRTAFIACDGEQLASNLCRAAVSSSPKAKLQRELELRIRQFEQQYPVKAMENKT